MFGIKKKKKVVKKTKKVVENATPKETLKTKTEEEKEEKEVAPSNPSLSTALGKTEEKLENDFYVYQIKEFMKKTGLYLSSPVESLSAIEKNICSAKKYQTGGVLILPNLYDKLVDKESVHLKDTAFSVLIDFPFGLSTNKARKKEVGGYKFSSLENIILSIPTGIDDTFLSAKEKSQNQKILKKAENLGVLVSADFGEEVVKKTFKAYRDMKMQSFTLFCLNLKGESLLSMVRVALEYKGNKSLFVVSSVDTPEELGEMTALGVDRVYTPFIEKIGSELLQKFSVTL